MNLEEYYQIYTKQELIKLIIRRDQRIRELDEQIDEIRSLVFQLIKKLD